MTAHTTPKITLNDGTTIPQLGFGTLRLTNDRRPTPENRGRVAEIVALALEVGYRHIDTAQTYGNERGIGQAIADSGIPRQELFITSKLGNDNHRPDDVRRTFDKTLTDLGVDYLDSFLMHWPLPTLYDGDFVSTWKAMTEPLADGRLRSAGVANFHPDHLNRIIDETGVIPAVNQIESHPYSRNDAVRAASRGHGIEVEAWSPLGQGALLGDPVIAQIAAAHHKTIAQVILRWHIQRGDIVFPNSVRRERMEQNFAIFDFALMPEDMAAIDALDQGENGRIDPNPDTFDWVPEPISEEPTL
jgi:2,5-diketo-D-gluconate reductase A